MVGLFSYGGSLTLSKECMLLLNLGLHFTVRETQLANTVRVWSLMAQNNVWSQHYD